MISVTDVQLKGGDTWLATSEGLIQYSKGKNFIVHNPEKQGFASKYLQYLEVLNNDYFVFLRTTMAWVFLTARPFNTNTCNRPEKKLVVKNGI